MVGQRSYSAGSWRAAYCFGVTELWGRNAAMEGKVRLFGHPLHPMLIVAPLGLLCFLLITLWAVRLLRSSSA